MQLRGGLRRVLLLLVLALVGIFGTAAIVLAMEDSGLGADDEVTLAPQRREPAPDPSPATTLPEVPPPPTTQPPPPPEPEPEPEPEPPPRTAANVSWRDPAPAPPPEPAPAIASPGCSVLSGGGLVSAHQGFKPFGVSGALNAGAQSFALTLCGANSGGSLFHSGQAAGENLGWIGASGCVNDAGSIFQAWLSSPGHRSNIERFGVMGAGVACDGSNTYFVVQYG